MNSVEVKSFLGFKDALYSIHLSLLGITFVLHALRYQRRPDKWQTC